MPGSQFPYPRKSSNSADARPIRTPSGSIRIRNLKSLAPYIAAVATFVLLVTWLFRDSNITPQIPPGTPGVVIVTPLDPDASESYKENIKENRRDYAARHGYTTFFPNTTDYDLTASAPQSWSTIPSLRHAMTLWPHTPWLFYLSSSALIMEPKEPLEAKILEPRLLESLMIVDKPVVPPDSVIKTFPHLNGERVDFILTQDREGLAHDSLLIKTGDWAKFFLDTWFDPLYRSYNFQKAEAHALEHIVQWHGTVLAKLALVPQRLLNSYTRSSDEGSNGEGMSSTREEMKSPKIELTRVRVGIYHEGDFVANARGCNRDRKRDCEEELRPLMSRWRELRDAEKR